VTLVGDKGMIRGPQIEEIEKHGHSFITTIAKKSILSLLASSGHQTTLLDENLLELIQDGHRYIMRRNPVRAIEVAARRADMLASLEQQVVKENAYLAEHPRAQVAVAQKHIEERAARFKLSEVVSVMAQERVLRLVRNEEALIEASKLDGCYAMRTNIDSKVLSKDEVHEQYKRLSLVEDTFRCSKTELLEMRPIHVRLAKRTRGHILTVMLAYLIIKELESCWRDLNLTVREGVDLLRQLQTATVKISGVAILESIPTPNQQTRELLKLANVTIPKALAPARGIVSTRKKLGKDRKSP
jgi:transposase